MMNASNVRPIMFEDIIGRVPISLREMRKQYYERVVSSRYNIYSNVVT